jgi:carbon monoxide dehydrogenase subunit G
VRFSNTIIIRRPVADVFAFVSNLENAPRWNYALVETRKTSDGPVGVGTTYRQTRSIPTRSEEVLEVTELEANRRFAFIGDLGPFHGTLAYDFEEADGGTRLTNSADLEGRGLARVAGSLAANRISSAVAANLDALKDLLERPA